MSLVRFSVFVYIDIRISSGLLLLVNVLFRMIIVVVLGSKFVKVV